MTFRPDGSSLRHLEGRDFVYRDALTSMLPHHLRYLPAFFSLPPSLSLSISLWFSERRRSFSLI